MPTPDRPDERPDDRPGPPNDPSRLAAELHAVLMRLQSRTRAASAGSELTASQRSVAARLREDGAATTAELARAEFVRPQSMRMTVAALEERGLVHRTAHPTDGRQQLIDLTELGSATIDAILVAKHAWLTRALGAGLDEAQRATLAEALPLLRTLAEGEQR